MIMNPDLHRIFCNNGGAAQVEQELANESGMSPLTRWWLIALEPVFIAFNMI
jgi:hypothetical protein